MDTSVWVEFFRHQRSHAAQHLDELLETRQVALPMPVRIELLAGVRRDDRRRVSIALHALPLLTPDQATWNKAESIVVYGATRGRRFSVADALIAALAAQHDCALWSLDVDFLEMKTLDLVRLHTSPRA